MLKEIALVTITVTNLAQVEEAWTEHFAYEVRERGSVSAAQADYWQAPAAAGLPYVVMTTENASGAVRFIEDAAVAEYDYMTSHGWNATELLVRDTDQVAAGMTDAHFDVIGQPRALWDAPDAPRVMQAVGPGGELLYLTTNAQAASALGVADSLPLVERPFIMVVGGPSMADFRDFYGAALGLTVDPPTPFRITTISKANQLDLATTYPLALAYLAPGYMIELDELPAAIGPRTIAPGHLPPGVALVSFTVDQFPDGAGAIDWVSTPRMQPDYPSAGRRTALIRGPAGELLELIETGR